MQWGLTAENAKHIRQAKKSPGLRKKTVSKKQIAPEDSVNVCNIPAFLLLLAEDPHPQNTHSPITLSPSPWKVPRTFVTNSHASGKQRFLQRYVPLSKNCTGEVKICIRKVASEPSNCQVNLIFTVSELLTSFGSFREQSQGLNTARQSHEVKRIHWYKSGTIFPSLYKQAPTCLLWTRCQQFRDCCLRLITGL